MADMYKFEKNSSGSNASDSEDKNTSSSRKPTSRRYSSDEVADIIRIGLQDETGNVANTIDHEDLIAIGKEVGVSD